MARRTATLLAALLAGTAAALLPAAPAAAAPAGTRPAPAAGLSIAGGDVLVGGARCTLSFNLSGRTVLTGDCGPVGTVIHSGTVPVGSVTWVAADRTAGLLRITNPAVTQLPGVRAGGQLLPISGAARATVGRVVLKASAVSGLRSGTVTATNVTVQYAQGVISGLDRTTLCPSTGEGGAPIFAAQTALSITVGGSGSCSSGGTTYSRPVVPLLTALGLSIY